MTTKILWDEEKELAVFADNCRGYAFGPLMESVEEAEEFAEFLGAEPKIFPHAELVDKYWAWRASR